MQDELEALTKVLQAPDRPLAAIVGGAKVSTKLDLLGSLLAKVDILLMAAAWPILFSPRADIPWADLYASATSCRRRARSWKSARAKAEKSCCRSTRSWPRVSRRMHPRASSRWTAWGMTR